jgi:MFS family permease
MPHNFALKKPEGSAGSAVPAILIGLFVAFGGVLFGYDTGTISDILTMPYWRKLFSTGYINPKDGLPDVTPSQSSEIVSILSAGTFFGALSAAPTGDIIGRRPGLMASTVVFTFGVILQTAATAIPLFVAGRFFAGYGVGMISAMSKTVPTSPLSANYSLCTALPKRGQASQEQLIYFTSKTFFEIENVLNILG